MKRWALLLTVLPIAALSVVGDQRQQDALTAAQGFLSSLRPDQTARAAMPFEDENRTLWLYVPAQRKGLAWREMDAAQAAKGAALLKASLSDLGYQRTETVRKLEAVLGEIEHNPQARDRDYYVFAFFGAPNDGSKWGWRYEGHHVSINFTYVGNKLVASTPQFFGSNPAEVASGPEKGTRMLGKEEDMGFALLASLSPDQRKKAVLEATAPGDIFTSQTRKAERLGDTGLQYSEMTKPQQEALLALVRQNALAQRPEEVGRRMQKIEKAGYDHLVFAWMGGDRPGVGHYYRIQGPTFVIEFDNTQNNADHIHLAWRDFEGDFGRDVLAEHYEHDHSHGN